MPKRRIVGNFSSSGVGFLVLLLIPLGAVLCFVFRRRLNAVAWLAIGLASAAVGRLLFLESKRILNGICTNALGR